jgi:hypothetical protein
MITSCSSLSAASTRPPAASARVVLDHSIGRVESVVGTVPVQKPRGPGEDLVLRRFRTRRDPLELVARSIAAAARREGPAPDDAGRGGSRNSGEDRLRDRQRVPGLSEAEVNLRQLESRSYVQIRVARRPCARLSQPGDRFVRAALAPDELPEREVRGRELGRRIDGAAERCLGHLGISEGQRARPEPFEGLRMVRIVLEQFAIVLARVGKPFGVLQQPGEREPRSRSGGVEPERSLEVDDGSVVIADRAPGFGPRFENDGVFGMLDREPVEGDHRERRRVGAQLQERPGDMNLDIVGRRRQGAFDFLVGFRDSPRVRQDAPPQRVTAGRPSSATERSVDPRQRLVHAPGRERELRERHPLGHERRVPTNRLPERVLRLAVSPECVLRPSAPRPHPCCGGESSRRVLVRRERFREVAARLRPFGPNLPGSVSSLRPKRRIRPIVPATGDDQRRRRPCGDEAQRSGNPPQTRPPLLRLDGSSPNPF